MSKSGEIKGLNKLIKDLINLSDENAKDKKITGHTINTLL